MLSGVGRTENSSLIISFNDLEESILSQGQGRSEVDKMVETCDPFSIHWQ